MINASLFFGRPPLLVVSRKTPWRDRCLILSFEKATLSASLSPSPLALDPDHDFTPSSVNANNDAPLDLGGAQRAVVFLDLPLLSFAFSSYQLSLIPLLALPPRPTRPNIMKTTKSSRRPAGASSGGGIRKRGPTRTDRDGDMDMEGSARGGKRGRADSGRTRGSTAGGRSAGGGRPQTRDRTLNAIQQAISDNSRDSSYQANIRHGKGGKGNSTQISISGWRNSNASSKRDGGVENLISFIERKLNAAPKGSRFKITKVCFAESRLPYTNFDFTLATPMFFVTPNNPNGPLASHRSTMTIPKSLNISLLYLRFALLSFQILLRFSDLQLVAG